MSHPHPLSIVLDYSPNDNRISSGYQPATDTAVLLIASKEFRLYIQTDIIHLVDLLDTLESEITSLRDSHSNHLLNSLDQAIHAYNDDHHREEPDDQT